ncbi:MAG: response regulator transcription factor [Gammaproteobacteria bacterium]|nr:response regulator transcription factor [Gammaproteobacteria bacterium]
MHILLVDDHKLFLDGFCLLLDKLDHHVQISSFDKGHDALEQITVADKFDLIILDLSMPDMNGIEILKTIRKMNILSPVVFVSSTDDIKKIALAMNAGASGFIPKHVDSAQMILALEQVLSGDYYIPNEMIDALNNAMIAIKNQARSIQSLTQRQLEVLQLISQGKSNKDIALTLSISEPTVKSHISVIFQTLQVSNRTASVHLAEKLGLI